MPLYEFVHKPQPGAEECRHITSTINSVAEHDKHPEKCDKCGYTGSEWRKIISRTTFKLQGWGWAKDGYQ